MIEGFVRESQGCERLEDVRVQVWLATETGGERDNRATVRTDAEGRYRIETPPTIPQFGEPNIHVAVDGDERFEPVFIRRVVDLDDKRAVVNLTLRTPGMKVKGRAAAALVAIAALPPTGARARRPTISPVSRSCWPRRRARRSRSERSPSSRCSPPPVRRHDRRTARRAP